MKLYEAIQLTHLEHIEDLPITDGVDGIKASIQFLKDNVDILKGHGNAEVFRKVDGCIHKDTLLVTDEGELTIEQIVNEKKGKVVLGYNFETQQTEFTKIKNRVKNNRGKRWVKILFDSDEIILTEDHEVFVIGRGWIKAKNLYEGDDIFSISPQKYQET